MASYFMGAGLLLQGRDLTTNGVWNFSYDREWNIENGNMAARADLAVGRRTNAVLRALTVLLVYVIGKGISNRAGGVIGGLHLIIHPLMSLVSARAMSDVLAIFFITLSLGRVS